jgi:hypothetical protein
MTIGPELTPAREGERVRNEALETLKPLDGTDESGVVPKPGLYQSGLPKSLTILAIPSLHGTETRYAFRLSSLHII